MSKKFLTPVGLPTGISNPSVGRTGDLFYRTDESAVYIYNGTIWEPLQGGGGGSYTISDTPPVDPNEGDVWFNSTEGATYIYYDAYWIEPVKNDAGPTGPAGAGIATGGTAGQILSKVDGTDYNTAWADLPPTTYVGDTAPSSPIDNQTWYQSSTGKTFIYYDSFWVEMLASTGSVGPAGSTGTTPSSYVSTAGGSLVTAASASTIPLRLKAAGSQTANLLEVQDSAGAVKVSLNASNELTASGKITGTTPNNGGSTGGLVIRAPAGGTQTDAFLQFVNNANNAQWGAIAANTGGALTYLAASHNFNNLIVGKTNTGGTVANSNGTGSFEAKGDNSNAATISFHRPANYAINMGLDTDNGFKIGGWSQGGTPYFQISSAGHNTRPFQAGFKAYNDSGSQINNPTLGANLIFNNVTAHGGFNSGAYNPATGTFTAPVAGKYMFSCNMLTNPGNSTTDPGFALYAIYKNAVFAHYMGHSHNQTWTMEGSAIVMDMAANDWVNLVIHYGSGHYGNYSYFSGYLLG